MKTLAERITEKALSEVGVRETKKNGGPKIAEYQMSTWLPVGEWPWCAAFVCWVIKESVGLQDVTFKRPKTAGAWDFERWCREQDNSVRLRKPHMGDIKAGDVIVFNFSHIGIAVGPPDKDGNVPTVEGNTNGAGSREGDGVYKKTRHISSIRSRIRFY